MVRLLLVTLTLLISQFASAQIYTGRAIGAEGVVNLAAGWDTHLYLQNPIQYDSDVKITLMGETITKVIYRRVPGYATVGIALSNEIGPQSFGILVEFTNLISATRYTMKSGVLLTGKVLTTLTTYGGTLPACNFSGAAHKFVALANPNNSHVTVYCTINNSPAYAFYMQPKTRKTFYALPSDSVRCSAVIGGDFVVEQVTYNSNLTSAQLCQ